MEFRVSTLADAARRTIAEQESLSCPGAIAVYRLRP